MGIGEKGQCLTEIEIIGSGIGKDLEIILAGVFAYVSPGDLLDFHADMPLAGDLYNVIHANGLGGFGRLAVQLDAAAIGHFLGHRAPLDDPCIGEKAVESHAVPYTL